MMAYFTKATTTRTDVHNLLFALPIQKIRTSLPLTQNTGCNWLAIRLAKAD